MNRTTGTTSLLGFALALASCGERDHVAGNSANTGNAQAVGRILLPSGAPAWGTLVECRPDSLTPWDMAEAGWTTLTDTSGVFRCTDLPTGRVGIAAFDPGSGLSHWRDDTITTLGTPQAYPTDTLALPGKIRVALPPGTTGTLFLTGLDLKVAVRGEQELEIPDVPAGWTGQVKIARSITNISIIDTGIRIRPGQTDSAGYTRQSQRIRIPLAGGLTAAVTQLPLLVRLDSSWPGFATARPDGSDLRLATAAGKLLPLTMATWNLANREANFWTLIDTVPAPGDSIDLVVSWGHPIPATPSQAFSSAKGWIAAWPLGDTGTTIRDRLGAFSGTPTSTPSVSGGIAGAASRFDGRLSQILIPGSAPGLLDVPEAGPYTFSCWAKLKAYGTSRFVMGRGELGSHLKFQSTFNDDTNNWLAKDFRSSPGGGYFTLAHADTATWTHLAMTVSGNIVSLYINGTRQSVDSGFDTDATGRRPALFAIGASTDTLGATSQHFLGDLSEVWVQGVVRSPEWIRLAAANQRIDAPRVKAAR